jgi:hypothetical protein
MWVYTWAVGLVGLFPFVASRSGIGFWFVKILLLASAFVSLSYFLRDLSGGTWDSSAFHLEGNQYLQIDDQKKRLLQALTQTKHAVYLSGKTAFCYNEAPTLAVFTGNKSYIAWYWFESLTNYIDQAETRQKQNDDFYADAMTDRLHFLQSNNIVGVIIWPDDNLSDEFLDKLRKELAPTYDYIDCKGTGEKNAGVFLIQPLPPQS